MILLQGSSLARHFGSEVLFENVNIQVQDRSRVALVGRNGTGKSTLLKMLARIEDPDQGQVSYAKNTNIGYLDQHSHLDSNRTIYEEMLTVFEAEQKLLQEQQEAAIKLGDPDLLADEEAYQEHLAYFDRLQSQVDQNNVYSFEAEIRSVLHGFNFPEEMWTQPVNQLSGGQKTRLAMAQILLRRYDLLILDEPTNHLDIKTLNWLEDYLQRYPGALLIVSHDRYFLDKMANEVYELRLGNIHHYKGNYTYYLEERELRLRQELEAYESQQKKMADLEDYVQRNIARASTTKMAQSRRKQLEKMDRVEKPNDDSKSIKFRFSTEEESGNIVYQAEDLAVGYDGEALVSPINLDIRKQQAVAIVGPNGIGKSTLLRTADDQIPPIAGRQRLGTKVQIGYYDQEFSKQNPKNTVLEELWQLYPTTPEKEIRTMLGNILFSGEDVKKSVANLSGGEKARLELAKLAMHHDNFLLMDEPTNHLDIDSKEVLEDALIHYDGTLMFVSHDRYFINRIATVVIELSENGSKIYLGDYDYYLEKKREEAEVEALEKAETEDKQTTKVLSDSEQHYHNSKVRQREQRSLERKVSQLETTMEELETKIAELEAAMAQPEVFNNYEKTATYHTEQVQLQEELEYAMAEWEEAAIALEEFN